MRPVVDEFAVPGDGHHSSGNSIRGNLALEESVDAVKGLLREPRPFGGNRWERLSQGGHRQGGEAERNQTHSLPRQLEPLARTCRISTPKAQCVLLGAEPVSSSWRLPPS